VRTRADQLAKSLLRETLVRMGTAETEVEVAAAIQRIDVWCVPDPGRAALRAEHGLLGELAVEPCLFEPFSNTPTLRHVLRCVRKQLAWQSELERRSGADVELPLPPLHVVSTGRPETALEGLGCELSAQGIYATPPGFRVFVIVLSELPPTRRTLMLRLLGTGRILKAALRDLTALPDDAWEKSVALPWLVHLGIESSGEQAGEEEVPVEIQEWFKSYQQKLREEGREEGRRLALSHLLAKRLGRALTEQEQATLATRLEREGEDRVDEVVVSLPPGALAAWLADADAG